MSATIEQQISCLKREIALRKNVYPKWVESRRMKQADADREIETMTAALHTLMTIEHRRPAVTQKGVLTWAVETWGVAALNVQERGLRCAEEAIEVAHNLEVPMERVAAVMGRVYSRPKGELWQELGGAFNTLLAAAERMGIDLYECLEREWERVHALPREHFVAKQQAKFDEGAAIAAPGRAP